MVDSDLCHQFKISPKKIKTRLRIKRVIDITSNNWKNKKKESPSAS